MVTDYPHSNFFLFLFSSFVVISAQTKWRGWARGGCCGGVTRNFSYRIWTHFSVYGMWEMTDEKFCFFLPMSTWEKILISEILFVKINKRMSVDVCRQVFHIDSRFSSLSFLLNGTSLWKKKDAQQMWNANFSRFGYSVCRRPPR